MKKGIFGLVSALLIMLLVGLQGQQTVVSTNTTQLHINQQNEPATAQILDVKN
ncbi:hypothetical protein HCI99_07375 [Listeria booriae]|uniref:Uncharacterized protein n=1 Tax=Listeria booriae TaxID=1552123 RepID=A0A7X1CBV3_9LIST|nr:hypothetical protein [Listeria booriae]MBC1491645.1 hypothetical protein [Listeria booriae]